MISIIICSVNTQLLNECILQIEKTIAIDFEIISINNKTGSKGICEVYNKAIGEAKYEILCFMHEDVMMQTLSWGKKIENYFKLHPQYGIIGVAGSKYKSVVYSGWGTRNHTLDVQNLIQIIQSPYQEVQRFENYSNQIISEVITLDGMWFCVQKKVFEYSLFDDITFSNFHCYDIDFCLQVWQGGNYKIGVVFDIMVKHYSTGNYNSTWFTETQKLHAKWQKSLPISILPITKVECKKIETSLAFVLRATVVNNNITVNKFLSHLWSVPILKIIGLKECLKQTLYVYKDIILKKRYNI